ncbi:MAG: dihydrofolate reductase, partial [Muribaculaceae bacterium]|nr:dihydrofolate reductase [Muribaculaceae bacterium]
LGLHTVESLRGALPGRRNIVLTTRPGYSPAGAETASALQEALAMCADAPEVMIIGGAQVYAEAMPLADELLLTLIDADAPDADVHFPAVDPAVWTPAATDGPHTDPATGLGYSFVTYRRR